jgi:hypothetical protein
LPQQKNHFFTFKFANHAQILSNLEPRTSNLEPRTSNLEPRTSNLEPRISNLEPHSPKFWYLGLCLVFLSTLTFFSCQKDLLPAVSADTTTSQDLDGGLSTKLETPIPIDEAEKWFNKQLLESSIVNGFVTSEDSSLFKVTPRWDAATNVTNEIGTQFVSAPLGFRFQSGNYLARVLIRRLPNGSLTGSYLVYLPDNNRGNRPKDYTGAVIYTDFNGNFTHGYKLNNGRVIGTAHARRSQGRNVQPRSCQTVTVCGTLKPIAVVADEWICIDVSICGGSTGTYTGPNFPGGFPVSGTGGGGGSSSSSWGVAHPTFSTMVSQVDVWGLRGITDLITSEPNLFNGILAFIGPSRDDAKAAIVSQLVNQHMSDGSSLAVLGPYIGLFVNTDFFNASQAVNFSNFATFKRFTSIGFTGEEFGKLYLIPKIFREIQSNLRNIPENEINQAVANFRQQIDWDDLNRQTTQINPTPRDTRLDLANLENSNYFTGFSVGEVRERVRLAYPTLEQWQINISAGVALENAYAYTTGFRKGFNVPASPETPGAPKARTTRPDFLHPTSFQDINTGEVKRWEYGGKIEVKTSETPITLATNGWQIAAEIAMAARALPDDYLVDAVTSGFPLKDASHYKAGSYTLVVPYGSVIDPSITAECTRLGVNFYVSYAFVGLNNEVVFSNPKRQNNLGPEATNWPSRMDKGAILDFDKATVYWRDSNQRNNLGKDSND